MDVESLEPDRAGGQDDRTWEERPAAGWEEFIAGRDRYLVMLAEQSAAWRASRRLPATNGRRYASASVVKGEGAPSR